METNQMTSKAYFKTLTIVYFALLAGQVLFAILSLVLVQTGKLGDDGGEFGEILIYTVSVFLIGGIIASTVMFKKSLSEAKNKNTLLEKMNFYRSALIVRYAPLEGVTMFAIVAYILTGNLLFMGMAAMIIVIFLIIKPSPEKAINDLELSYEEKQVLSDEEGILG